MPAKSQPGLVLPPAGLELGGRRLLAGLIPLALAPSALILWILWLAPVDGLQAERAALASRDFGVLWAAGRLAAGHWFATLYDPAQLTGFMRQSFGAAMPEQIWPYPPTALLLASLLTRLPMAAGQALYTAAGAAMLWASMRAGGLNRILCALVLLSPAVAGNALAGQNGALTASALVAGLLLLDRRPLVAGAALGLLVIKPQLGLLVPICLLAGRHRRAALAAAATGLAFASASLLAFGPDAWTLWLIRARPAIAAYFEAPWIGSAGQLLFVSTFMALRSLGAGLLPAYAAQSAVTLACAALVWRAWRPAPAPDRSRRLAITLVATALASPWIHDYDMPILAIAVALLMPGARPWAQAILAAAWLWPGLLSLVPLRSPVPVASLALVLIVASQVSLAIPNQGGNKGCRCRHPAFSPESSRS